MALGLGFLSRRRAVQDEPSRICARYRSRLIPISSAECAPGRPLVAVATVEALMRLAEHANRPVLHLENDGAEGAHSFLLEDDTAAYRYRAYATEAARQKAECAEAAPSPRQEATSNGAQPQAHHARGIAPALATILFGRNRDGH